MTPPSDPTSSRAGLAEARVVSLLDPVAELLRGALPYSDASAELPDDQAIPTLRVRHRPNEPGLRMAVDRFRDDERTDTEVLDVDRLPLDRSCAIPRRRAAAMPESLLHVVSSDPEVSTSATGTTVAEVSGSRMSSGLVAVEELGGGSRRVLLPVTGPGPEHAAEVERLARAHRMVVLDPHVRGADALLAGLVLRIVAGGTACWCPAQVAARLDLLGPGLRESLVFDRGEAERDDLVLAARTATQKREAWSDHDLRLGWTGDGTGEVVPRLLRVAWPSVAVVLASRRPGLVPIALQMIAAQSRVDLEVVVALHGGGDVTGVERHLRRLDLGGRVIEVPAAVPFGSVINQAIATSRAPVVLKWDDDDLYGPRHVQDLLVARRQTGAALVGRAAEFIHFDASGRTIWRMPARAETSSVGMAGGTFLTDRAALDEVGGYPDVSRAVDHHLKTVLRDRGLGTFRTHSFGFVLRRHGQGHTWDATDDALTSSAVRTFDGLPEVLQLGPAAEFTRLPPG